MNFLGSYQGRQNVYFGRAVKAGHISFLQIVDTDMAKGVQVWIPVHDSIYFMDKVVTIENRIPGQYRL